MDAKAEEDVCCAGAYILGAEQDSHRVSTAHCQWCYSDDGYHNVVSDFRKSDVS